MDVEKIIVRMKNQPNAICPADAEKVLEAYAYTFDRQKAHTGFMSTRNTKKLCPSPTKIL